MPISYVGAGTFNQSSNGNSSASVAFPSGIQDGDLLILTGVTVGTANNLDEPSGTWTSIGIANGTAANTRVWWKRHQTGDTQPSLTNGLNHVLSRIHAFRGVVPSGIPWSDASAADGTGTVVSISGVTTQNFNEWLVVVFGVNDDTLVSSGGTFANAAIVNETKRTEDASTQGTDGSLVLYTADTPNIQNAGAFTATLAVSEEWGAVSFTLTPGSRAPSYGFIVG